MGNGTPVDHDRGASIIRKAKPRFRRRIIHAHLRPATGDDGLPPNEISKVEQPAAEQLFENVSIRIVVESSFKPVSVANGAF